MTHREFLDKNYKTIYDLQSVFSNYYMDNILDEHLKQEEADAKNSAMEESIIFAMSAIRHNLVRLYKNILVKYFIPVDNTMTDVFRDPDVFMTECTYCIRHSNLCCNFSNCQWYILKLKTPVNFIQLQYNQLSDPIEIESPDDYPHHKFPDDYTGYEFPEEAMLYWALNKMNLLDAEVDEQEIGNYDHSVGSYAY